MTVARDFVILSLVRFFLRGVRRRISCTNNKVTGLKKSLKNFKIGSTLFISCALIYFEVITKLLTCDTFFNIGLVFMPIFSVAVALLIVTATDFMSVKAAKIFTGVCLCVIAFIHAAQIVYYSVFNKYLIFYSITAGGVGNVLDGGAIQTTLKSILGGVPAMLAFSIPIILMFRFGGKKILFSRISWLGLLLRFVPAIVVYISTVLIVGAVPELSTIQSGTFDPNLSVGKFGLIRTEILDLKYNLFGIDQKIEILEENPLDNTSSNEPSKEPPEVVYTPNVMNIDFNSLLANETDETYKMLNEYFSTREPTQKNEYTGMYKGYNLISITAEGFSPYCIDPELTPTLYKMSTEGFKFNNFYTPVWGVSTSDGEYVHCTGLIPKSGVWSFYKSGSNYMPFCLGNMFRSIGVDKTFAYHNNSYTFYRRDISHPNMGYTYKGYGSGVEEYVKKQWPQSDLELISGSVKDYLSDDKPFMAYYMTVSGHLEYNFIGNMMAYKNRDAVKDLDCSETLKAYYACNIELDKAMEKLLLELEKAGVLDKTVISITPDHYPYGLEQDGNDKYSVWREMLGHDVETEFELYKSSFILYCAGTKNAPTIDKYCAAIDILPTVLNLFGFEYDSRLLMGNDIFSDTSDLVIMSNRSFITDRGKYSATEKTFTAFEGKEFASEEEQNDYVQNVRKIINNKFSVSTKILEKDYYRYLFKK